MLHPGHAGRLRETLILGTASRVILNNVRHPRQGALMHSRPADAAIVGEVTNAGRVKAAVTRCFEVTAADQERALQPLTDNLLLLDSGLDSLCFAIIVAQLEDELGVDPFSDLDDAFFPVTFGDFVQLYETAASQTSAA
jgi:acyl carrier protein